MPLFHDTVWASLWNVTTGAGGKRRARINAPIGSIIPKKSNIGDEKRSLKIGTTEVFSLRLIPTAINTKINTENDNIPAN